MANYYTANDMSIDMMGADEAMLLLPAWMSTSVKMLWNEG